MRGRAAFGALILMLAVPGCNSSLLDLRFEEELVPPEERDIHIGVRPRFSAEEEIKCPSAGNTPRRMEAAHERPHNFGIQPARISHPAQPDRGFSPP